ncbi:MAG: response regulator transcription factor [Spirochaetes bacterium]|nr:MAG: response regulator transcription factor [Spirochaetota bacterium]
MKAALKKRLFIVDDHKIFREGLSLLIGREPDLEICGEAEEADAALKDVIKLKPHLILLDITLKNSNGLEFIRDLQKTMPEIPVLILSMHDEIFYAERAIKAGAKGYVMKHEPAGTLMDAIHKVLDGKIYLSGKMTERAVELFSETMKNVASSPIESLSNRELQVFELIGRGYTTYQIAKETNLNIKTIGTYREKIKAKLNLKSATELTKYAIHWMGNI